MSKLNFISEKIDKNDTNLIPLGYKVLIKMDKLNDTTKGGIIITTKTKEMESAGSQTARIVDFGPSAFTTGPGDLLNDWDRKPSVGNRVMINRYNGIRVYVEDLPEEEYRLISDREILAIIKE